MLHKERRLLTSTCKSQQHGGCTPHMLLNTYIHSFIVHGAKGLMGRGGRVGDLWPATKTGFALDEGAHQLDLPVERKKGVRAL